MHLRRRPPPHVSVVHTLPAGVADLVRAALPHVPVDPAGVAINVKRHGVRRAFFRPCAVEGCALVGNAPAGWSEGEAVGPGHLYGRRRDLAACLSSAGTIAVDRTSHWVTGRAYDGVPYPRAVPRGTTAVVTLKVPSAVPDGHLPADRTYHRAKRAGATRIEVPADDVVFVLAHELTHVDQFRTRRPRSEVEAETAGRAALERWVGAGRPGADALA